MNSLPYPRRLLAALFERLTFQPGVVLLGPRQVGKTTLARELAASQPDALVLDLEREADRARLTDPALFLERNRQRLVVLDEVQCLPDIFSALRAEIDADRRPGRFLLLGSASGRLLQQGAESLAGRAAYLELTPLRVDEVVADGVDAPTAMSRLWQRGGFPRSYLAASDSESLLWRSDFVQAVVGRDLPALGVTIPAQTLTRFWRMCAHLHGQALNASQLGASLGGASHSTIGRYVDLFVDAMLLRRLPAWSGNLGKRLVKAPRIYLRDSGLLHALLNVASLDDLYGHPMAGPSWEGWLIEQVIGQAPPLTDFSYFRTAAGAEMDLVADRGGRRIGFEMKLSQAPKLTKGFWLACEDLGLSHAYVVAPVAEPYPLAANVDVIPPTMISALWS